MSGYLKSSLAGAVAIALLVSVSAVQAGPVRDFERELSAAYAHYRAALFLSNQNDKAKTEAALSAFDRAWAAITAARRASPPPQYADDARWSETLDKATATIATAKSEVARGDIAKAHVTLEAVRDLIGDLRLRNGMISLSDRVNAYHAHMEHVVGGTYTSDAEGNGRLREDVAVLAFLAQELGRFPPTEFASDESFKLAVGAVRASVDALQAAVRAGDGGKIEILRKALKPAYARFFAKYG